MMSSAKLRKILSLLRLPHSKNAFKFKPVIIYGVQQPFKIDAVLQRNRNEERMEMMSKAHKIATPNAPSVTTHAELFSSSLGLLNGNASSYNAADAYANQEMVEMLSRKKKRRKGLGL